MDWRCLRCGYIHSADPEVRPSRCPVCGSTRLSTLPSPPRPRIQTAKPEDVSSKIYRLLHRLKGMSVEDQEEARRRLREVGVHVLSLSGLENLGSTLTLREAEGYSSLVERTGFGLVEIGGVIVAVSPDSPIRAHVGVNPRILRVLKGVLKRSR